jgi:hypothetical protein
MAGAWVQRSRELLLHPVLQGVRGVGAAEFDRERCELINPPLTNTIGPRTHTSSPAGSLSKCWSGPDKLPPRGDCVQDT